MLDISGKISSIMAELNALQNDVNSKTWDSAIDHGYSVSELIDMIVDQIDEHKTAYQIISGSDAAEVIIQLRAELKVLKDELAEMKSKNSSTVQP